MPNERTRMIAARSLSNAWWVGIVGIILLFWADVMGIWRPEALTALGLSALLLIVPAAMYLVYRSSRGEPGT